jgi:ferredoxin-NADP reductase
MTFRSRLVSREIVAEQTLALRFTRAPGFRFLAGQYLDITVINAPEQDAEGPMRSFSIASAPDEPELLVVMRMRDTAFKRTLAGLEPGAEVILEGPAGDFVLDAGEVRPRVFIAGGVGIAPFLSMLREARASARIGETILFYSNRRPEDTVFLQELEAIARELPGFRLVATMTRMAESAREWQGETAHVGTALLGRHLSSVRGPVYYVCGAPTLIAGVRYELEHAGVAGDDIMIEMFGGY